MNKVFFASVAVAAAVLLSCAAPAPAETIFGLDISNRIFSFDSATPGTLTFVNGGAPVSGLAGGESLVGIDFRPVATNSPGAAFNGVLYSVGSSNRLYTINTATGAATPVGAAGAFTLNGNAFGIDFDPASDLLGVVSDTGQNIRLNPFSGGLESTGTALAYAIGDSGFGTVPNVVAAGYTDNFGGAQTSTLYGIDFMRGVFVRQGGATGQLTTIGPLGVTIVSEAGLDVSGNSGIVYAAMSTVIGPLDPSSSLYTIDVATGTATRIGSIGQVGGVGAFVTRDIAAPVGRPVPEPGGPALLILGLAGLGRRRSRRPVA